MTQEFWPFATRASAAAALLIAPLRSGRRGMKTAVTTRPTSRRPGAPALISFQPPSNCSL